MIKQITIDHAQSFYRSNKRGKQVSFSDKGKYFGYFKNDQLVGMISTSMVGQYIRIKSFMVMDIYRGEGIGTALLDFVVYEGNKYSAFATGDSIRLFERKGFKVVSEKKNNIKYLKYE